LRKAIIHTILYAVIFALLTVCEKKLGITGFAVGFLYALLYCKENPFLAVCPYLAVTSLVYFDWMFVIYTVSSVLPACVLFLVHYKGKKAYRMWSSLLCVFLSQTAKFILFHAPTALVAQIVGVVVSLLFFYVSVVFLYPFIVRGLRYRFSDTEMACCYLFIAILGAGLYSFSFFSVTFLYFVCVLIMILGSVVNTEKSLIACISLGLGATILSQSFVPLVYCAVYALAFLLFSSVHRWLGGVAGLLAFGAVGFFWNHDSSPYLFLPVIGASVCLFIPRKLFSVLTSYKQGYQGKFALRTMMNRDREDVGNKIGKIAYAFEKVKVLLSEEENLLPTEEEIAQEMNLHICNRCTQYAVCHKKMDTMASLRTLILAAIDSGKASILDASPVLSENCIHLPKLIMATNETIASYNRRKEQQTGVQEGKEMVIAQLQGTAELLRNLSSSIQTGFGFDLETENKITEELGYADIICSDVALFGDGSDGVTVVVRKTDADKPNLKSILSAVIGKKMTETERSGEMNGMMSLHFACSPAYGVLYGIGSVSADETCGDSGKAVKIGYDKIMFVLSDGIGTGEDAKQASACIVNLIESFYLAGFEHKTVFTSVSKLLALRKKENFSALDIAVVDTKVGDFDFIKQGGRESYILSKNGLEVIEGGSVPLGIIEDTEPQIVRKHLEDGNIVILLSDGVADRLHYSDIFEFLVQIHSVNPQVIADRLLQAAVEKGGRKDDMTVMAIRVVRNKL